MRTLVALLILSMAALVWLRYENIALNRSFSQANNVASTQKRTIEKLQNQLNTAWRISGEKELAQAALRDALNAADARAQRREWAITILLHENEQLNRWYRADLPDVVHQLHRRAACVDASDCLQRLPESQPLPDAGQLPTNPR